MHRLPEISRRPAHNRFSIGPAGNYEELEMTMATIRKLESLNCYGHGPQSFIGGEKIGIDIHQHGDLIIWLSTVGSATSGLSFSKERDISVLSRL